MDLKRKFQVTILLLLLYNLTSLNSFQLAPSSSSWAESSSEEDDDMLRTIDFSHERCQTETLSGDYSDISHFYKVDPFLGENGVLDLLVRFKGTSDGHILFTQFDHLSEPAYAVILGSYNNKVSEIRRSLYDHPVFKINTPEILSTIQFRGFRIRYNEKNGELWVYSEGSYMPLLHWKDSEPLKVNYFSFAAYTDVVIEVAFNCKPKDLHSLIFQHKSDFADEIAPICIGPRRTREA